MRNFGAKNTAPRAVLYLRISVDTEGNELGVSRQREACLALAKRQGLTVVDEYVDNDKSAYSRKPRPAFEKLLADMGGDLFDVVIVWASDRLYRRMTDLTRITDALQTTSVSIEQVQGGRVDLTTAEGILRAQVMGSVAEYESRHKGDRLRARVEQRAHVERRMPTTRLSIGWRWVEPCPAGDECRHGKRCSRAGIRPRAGSRAGVEPDPVESTLVHAAYELIADGGSLNACVRLFVDAGVPPRYAAQWNATTMRSTLTNPRNAGLVAHNGEIVAEASSGHQIVSVDLWERVQRILRDPARKTAGRPAGTIFSGIATCGRCGGVMNASHKHENRTKETVPVYVCRRRRHLSRRRHLIDQATLPVIRAVLVEHAALLSTYTEPETTPLQRSAADEAYEIQQSIDAYLSMAGANTMKPAQVTKIVADLNVQLEDAQRRAVVAAGRPAISALLKAEDVGAMFDALAKDDDVTPLRTVLRELVDEIRIVPEQSRPDIRWQAWVLGALDGEAISV